MKCPECNYDQKVKYGLICRCGYEFTFNPKTTRPPGQTDGRFVATIARANQNETVYFTRNQLYAAFVTKYGPSRWGTLYGGACISILGAFLTYFQIPIFGYLFLGIGVLTTLWGLFIKPGFVSRKQFENWINAWLQAGKNIPMLIEHPTLHQPPPDWEEKDIYDYGCEKLLIVQHDLMVDLLVLNNQHTEQRMLVLSESGYPNYLVAKVQELLADRPELPIFLLHDATREGMQMAERMKTRASWLDLSQSSFVDLGFTPEDFKMMERARNYDSGRWKRELPMDAIVLAAMATNLSFCFDHNMSMHELFLQRHQDNTGSYG